MNWKLIFLILVLLLLNIAALTLIWEQPDCAASMECYSTETIPKHLLGSPAIIGMLMTENLKSAKGHAKNARNQLDSMETAKTKDREIERDSVEYAYDEVLEAIEQIEKALEQE